MQRRTWLSIIELVSLIFVPGAVHAATITVSTTAIDSVVNGNCTLLEAIHAANSDAAVDACAAGSGADTINLPAGTYALTAVNNTTGGAGNNGLPPITSTMTIQGTGNPVVTRSGATTFRFFYVDSTGNLTLNGLTLTNGDSTVGGHDGGAIRNFGPLTVTNCTFSGNRSNAGGSAIFNNDSTVTVTGTTFSGNLGTEAVGTSRGTITIVNSTIAGNPGGLDARGPYIVTNSTIASNSGEGIGGRSGPVTLRNTIVANNTTNCANATIDGGNNLQFPGTTCGASITSADPLLGALASNGGPTQTIALSAGSPAIDAANPAVCPATDQRGVARTGICDIGAFEFASAVPTLPQLGLIVLALLLMALGVSRVRKARNT